MSMDTLFLELTVDQGAASAPQLITITNTGGGQLSWTAYADQFWLELSASSGTAPSTLEVTLNAGLLQPGFYAGGIMILGPGGYPYTVPVFLSVRGPQIDTSLDEDHGVAPIEFEATQSGPTPVAQQFTISNSGGGTLSWSITDDASWLTVSPASGTNSGVVTLTASHALLLPGVYSAKIRAKRMP